MMTKVAKYQPTVYIAGPMTGKPDWNYPEFHRAAASMRDLGWKVLNPAENFGGDMSLPYATYICAAVRDVVNADAVLLLGGWKDSKGAKLEATLGGVLGLRLLDRVQAPYVALLGDDYTITKELGIPCKGPWLNWPRKANHDLALKTWVEEVRAASPAVLNTQPLRSTAPEPADPFGKLLDDIRGLHDRKKSDYTGGEHPLANYKNAGESIGVSVEMAMFSRMNEKVFRAKNLLRSGEDPAVTDESLRDTFKDIAIIAMLIHIALDPTSGWGD